MPILREAMKRALLFLIAMLLIVQRLGFAALQISADKKAVSFGLMHLGETKELAQYGGYDHELVCSSTNNTTWYVKISLLKPLSSAQDSIPLENFKWQLVASNGNGTIANPYQFKEFSLFPELVYISAPEENSGRSVYLQFKYYLKIPEIQTRGSYNTVVRFTMTEVL
ncbi:MAG: hypothetical protein ISS44_04750 [Candidatus Omnitrophica bacterium]|nr:hypothetical protein [Candidatus Omnitrophota bacterium]